jgi:hypothetical protein
VCRNMTRVATAPGSVFVRPYIEQHYFTRAKLNQYLQDKLFYRGRAISPVNAPALRMFF